MQRMVAASEPATSTIALGPDVFQGRAFPPLYSVAMDASRYVDQIDRVLAAACDLLPTPDGTSDGLEPFTRQVEIPRARAAW